MADDDEVRITLRMPAALRDVVSAAGKGVGRSLNSEIIHRLEQSFSPDSRRAEVERELHDAYKEVLMDVIREAAKAALASEFNSKQFKE